jgi:ubiquinone/menaquinone biosynthesis C-methylase UbiE
VKILAGNIDPKTVEAFGEEWAAYDQSELVGEELREMFNSYFSMFPIDDLPPAAEGFDLGCGSGRWALLTAPRVGRLHCIDPSPKALDVARRRLAGCANAEFHLASAADIALEDGSQDFGYCLGVLHHIPDTEAGMASCVRKLKAGAPFLVYLYYDFENRPPWFRALWRITDVARRVVSRLPFAARKAVTSAIAATVYFPLARTARYLERRGRDVASFPLSAYRNSSFYIMRTDALDRFGTRLEKRFSKAEIEQMMRRCGLEEIVFSDAVPHWVACGRKKAYT